MYILLSFQSHIIAKSNQELCVSFCLSIVNHNVNTFIKKTFSTCAWHHCYDVELEFSNMETSKIYFVSSNYMHDYNWEDLFLVVVVVVVVFLLLLVATHGIV